MELKSSGPAREARLPRDNDLPDSLGLSLRLGLSSEVHPRRQRPHIIRTGPEVHHLPPADVEQVNAHRQPLTADRLPPGRSWTGYLT